MKKLLALFLFLSSVALGQVNLASTQVTGVLPIANGGMGRNSVCANNELPISNGSGYVCIAKALVGPQTLTALTDVTAKSGSGTIAIFQQDPTLGGTVTFLEEAGDSSCGAGDYWIKANSSTGVFRKCENGTISDVGSGGGGGGGDINAVGDCLSSNCFVDGTNNGTKLVYEGATIDGNQTELAFTGDPGGLFTVTIPNKTGTIALGSDNLGFFSATTSSQLLALLSDPTGTGLAVFNNSPVLTTPTIGDFSNAGHDHTNAAGGGQLDHGNAITGLGDDDHTQYVLLLGRVNGQTIIGGTGAGDDLTFETTSNVSKGSYIFAELDCSSFLNGGALTADAAGVVTCTDDDSGAGGSGDSIQVEDGDNSGTFTAVDTTVQIVDDGDINFVLTGGSPDQMHALVRADSVSLGNDTIGDYIQHCISGTGITGCSGGGEGVSQTIALSYSTTIGADPTLGVNQIVFSTDNGSGFISEGSVADAFEGYFKLPDVTGADSTQILLTDASTFSGDVTGTSGSMVVVDDSHSHGSSTIAALDTSDVTTGTFADARIDGSQEADEINVENLGSGCAANVPTVSDGGGNNDCATGTLDSGGTGPTVENGLTDDVFNGAPGTANEYNRSLDRTSGLWEYQINGDTKRRLVTEDHAQTLTNKTIGGAQLVNDSVTVEKVEADLKTGVECWTFVDLNNDLPNTLDVPSIYSAMKFALTIDKVWCESDDGTGSPTIQLQKDDGTPTNMLSSALTCGTTPATTTSFVAGENSIAVDDEIDHATVSVTAGLKRLNVCFGYTIQ